MNIHEFRISSYGWIPVRLYRMHGLLLRIFQCKCEDHQRWDRRDRKVHFSLFHFHEGGASLPNLGAETKHVVVVAMVMATVHTNIVSHFDGRLLLDENNKIKTEI